LETFLRRLDRVVYISGKAIQTGRVVEFAWALYIVGLPVFETALDVQEVPFMGFEEYICLSDGTEVRASAVIPLGETVGKISGNDVGKLAGRYLHR
jgi:hypothetical protein